MVMRDGRTYIRVHDGITEHPKIIGLSVQARWALVALWCYSSRNLTDGFIPTPIAASHGKRVMGELEQSGMVERVEGGWSCHDYLEHQQSAEERRELKARRAAAGSKGGSQRVANLQANAKQVLEQTSSKTQAELELELEREVTYVVTDAERVVILPVSEEKASTKIEFWRAMLAACRIDPDAVNSLSRRDYQAAARALAQSNATHAEMERRAQAMRRVYTVPVTPTLLAKHWGEFTLAVSSTPDAKPVPRLPLPDPQVAVAGASAARESLKRTGAVT